MKKNIFVLLALAGTLAWTGCMKEEIVPEDPEEELTAAADSVWALTLQAVKSDTPQTKGLAIGDGDNEGNTTTLRSIWKENEEVKVFLGTTCIGTLTATPNTTDPHTASLSGEVITTAITEGVTTLTLVTPAAHVDGGSNWIWDYTGQVGKLLISDEGEGPAKSIERLYHYTMATSVKVTSVSGNAISTEDATFINQQSIYRLSFRYQTGETKTAIVTKSVEIATANGELVQSQSIDGGTVTKGAISVTLGTPSSDPFFVALRNGDATDEAITFTVIDTEDATYKGSKVVPAAYKAGGFVSVKNATLSRLGVGKSATVISTAEGVL